MTFKFSQLVLSLSLMTLVSCAQYAQAQQRIRFSPPTPPDPSTPSDRGTGAGARGCEKEFAGLTALVPSPRSDVPGDRWGLTISDRPTIWFNVPTGVKAGTLVEWKLRNANNKVIYRTTTQLPQTNSGVISFSIPKTVAPLSVSTYQWDFAIYCESGGRDPSTSSDDVIDRPLVRKGRIQRVAMAPALREELMAAKTSVEQAQILAKNGIWYDALTALGLQIRTTQGRDKLAVEAWNELLQQQKLVSKSAAMVTGCCQL